MMIPKLAAADTYIKESFWCKSANGGGPICLNFPFSSREILNLITHTDCEHVYSSWNVDTEFKMLIQSSKF